MTDRFDFYCGRCDRPIRANHIAPLCTKCHQAGQEKRVNDREYWRRLDNLEVSESSRDRAAAERAEDRDALRQTAPSPTSCNHAYVGNQYGGGTCRHCGDQIGAAEL